LQLDPYYQQQKCGPKFWLMAYGDIRRNY